jgi:hypothetical protein
MSMDPASMGLSAAGILASFLSGGQQPEIPAYQQAMGRRANQINKLMFQQSQSAPMSLQQERSGLAQTNALSSEQLHNQYQGLLSSLGPSSLPGAADALGRFQEGAAGQFAGNDMAAMLASLQSRQQMLGQAGQMALGGMYHGLTPGTPSPDLGGLFSNLARAYSFNKGIGQAPAFTAPTGAVDRRAVPYGGSAVSDVPGIYQGGQIGPAAPTSRYGYVGGAPRPEPPAYGSL